MAVQNGWTVHVCNTDAYIWVLHTNYIQSMWKLVHFWPFSKTCMGPFQSKSRICLGKWADTNNELSIKLTNYNNRPLKSRKSCKIRTRYTCNVDKHTINRKIKVELFLENQKSNDRIGESKIFPRNKESAEEKKVRNCFNLPIHSQFYLGTNGNFIAQHVLWKLPTHKAKMFNASELIHFHSTYSFNGLSVQSFEYQSQNNIFQLKLLCMTTSFCCASKNKKYRSRIPTANMSMDFV